MPSEQRPRIAFAGTPAFAVAGLNALLNCPVDIVAVYTQPDRRAGRGKQLRFSDVKQCALDAGLTVRQPQRMRDEVEQLRADDLDLLVVIAFGQLLPQDVLDTPRLGCINVHASLLPRWRGAAPIARAIAAGDKQTGVCLMQMTLGLDEGPVLACDSIAITPDHTGATLHDDLAQMGADLLQQHLSAILAGELKSRLQDDAQSNYAHKLTKAETAIDWQQAADVIDCQVRGFNPWPVATTMYGDTTLKIWRIGIENTNADLPPGTLLEAPRGVIRVATGTSSVRILELQRPGGRRQTSAEFLNGFELTVGSRLGQTL